MEKKKVLTVLGMMVVIVILGVAVVPEQQVAKAISPWCPIFVPVGACIAMPDCGPPVCSSADTLHAPTGCFGNACMYAVSNCATGCNLTCSGCAAAASTCAAGDGCLATCAAVGGDSDCTCAVLGGTNCGFAGGCAVGGPLSHTNSGFWTCCNGACAAAANCPSTLCGAGTAIAGCNCGGYTVTAADIAAGKDWCCAVSSQVFTTQAACNASGCGVACVNGTCAGGNICVGGAWVSHCTTGAMDCDETGTDCGGASCAACAAVPPPIPFGGIDMKNPISTSDFGKIIENFLLWILSVAGVITIFMLVIGGIMYMTAGGDEQKVATAKKVVTWTIVGLGLILISYSIIAVLDQILVQ